MAMRMRKSIKIAPGVKLNVGKKSAGVSVGGKYGRVSVNTSGRVTKSASIPGTGISYVSASGGSSSASARASTVPSDVEQRVSPRIDAIDCSDTSQLLSAGDLAALNNADYFSYAEKYLNYARSVSPDDAVGISNANNYIQIIKAETSRREAHPLTSNMSCGAAKNKWVAFFLCLFLGFLGVHRFYVGKVGSGVLYLCTCGLMFFGWIIDLVLILTGHFSDKYGRPLQQ